MILDKFHVYIVYNTGKITKVFTNNHGVLKTFRHDAGVISIIRPLTNQTAMVIDSPSGAPGSSEIVWVDISDVNVD